MLSLEDRPRKKKLVLSAAVVAAVCVVSALTFRLASNDPAPQRIQTNVLALTTTASATFTLGPTDQLTAGALKFVPGDSMQRPFDLSYAASMPPDVAVALNLSGTPSNPLLANTPTAFQLGISRCSVAWTNVGTVAAPNYTCGGTTYSVLAPRPAAMTGVALANLSAATRPPNQAGVDHLLAALTFSQTNTDFVHTGGISTALTYTFVATQNPPPAACAPISFADTVQAQPVPPTSNYTVTGTTGNDLIYGSPGPYTINANGGTDCILVYNNNTVTDQAGTMFIYPGAGQTNVTAAVNLGNGNNNTTIGDGTFTVTSGNGNDTVTVGNGTNTVTVGQGTDTVYGGTGTDTITAGNGPDTFYTGGRTSTSSGPTNGVGATTINVGNGVIAIYGGNGNDTFYLGTGSGVIDGGGGTNVCHVPKLSSTHYTFHNCTPVAP